jgi:hydrogenase expression/formation protein HypC
MCLGIPQRLTAITGIAGHTDQGLVDLSLLPDARPGDWVLNFLGTGREILTEDQAQKITAALAGLSALMQGGDLGDAFADLDARTPSLPPHLQAALDAGLATG